MDNPQAAAKPQSDIRKSISLNEALRFGTLEAKQDILEFPDFESCPSAPMPPYTIPLRNINPYIYAMLADDTDYRKAADSVIIKLLKNIPLVEQDILDYQMPKIFEFLTDLDIHIKRKSLTAAIRGLAGLSAEQKNKGCALVKTDTSLLLNRRALYKAALAAQNSDAINTHRTKQMHFEESPLTIVQELAKLR